MDAGKVTGTIRSFQGVNGPPTPVMEGLPNLVSQYKELHIDMVRTHDFMGPTEIDSLFANDDPMLTWLVPDTKQRAGLVPPEMRAPSFLIGALIRKRRRAIASREQTR